MHSDSGDGPVHVCLACHEVLAQVVCLACIPQNLALEERQRGVSPARAAAALVLDTGYFVLFNNGEHRFVLVHRVFLFLCVCARYNHGSKR